MRVDVRDFDDMKFKETIVSARHTELYINIDMYKPTIEYVVKTRLEPSGFIFSMSPEDIEELDRFAPVFVTHDFQEAVDYFNYIQELAEKEKLIYVTYM